jgi:cytochrome c oxidase subunit II
MKPKSNVLRIGIAAAVLCLGGAAAYVAAQPAEQVVKVTARKFQYTPDVIQLKKSVPVVLEFITEDVLMGFNVPELGVRADIVPGKVTRVRLVPDKTGSFPFHCDIFCGSGHEDMSGTINVDD